MFFSKKGNLVGLDIGSHTVKLVQLNAKETSFELLNFGMIPLQGEAFGEGRAGKPEFVAAAIQRLVNHLTVKDKNLAAAISGYDVMIKKIELPTMSEDEVGNRIRSELGQYIPYNRDEVDIDYQILDASKERPNYMEVLLVAAKKESVSDYVNLVRLAGLEPMVVDVDFFALSNAFEATYGFGKENIALLDIGASKSILDIIYLGAPVFTRGISIGGSQITEQIKDHFKVSYDDAERVKLGGVHEEISSMELEEIFIGVIRNWMGECKRAIDFYYSNYPENRIEKIYLSGGSCRIPGFSQVLQEQLDVQVEIFNPLSRIQCDSKSFDPEYIEFMGPQMAISLGLALRKAKDR